MITQITDRERELAAERDRYQEAADRMAAAHKVERDALAAENERLKEAARMGLEAMIKHGDAYLGHFEAYHTAIEALKEALGEK